jgi:hypothetical protein
MIISSYHMPVLPSLRFLPGRRPSVVSYLGAVVFLPHSLSGRRLPPSFLRPAARALRCLRPLALPTRQNKRFRSFISM